MNGNTPQIPDGCAPDAWDAIGAQAEGDTWTIPERNELGEIIGWSVRLPDGSKKCKPGSHRGLTLQWPLDAYAGSSVDDPVYVVEGATDTAAGIGLGVDIIGRPSATSGGDKLAALLTGRHGCIIAENDAGAGRTGADKIASQLVEKCSSVRIIFPPEGIKDLREWVIAGATRDDLMALAAKAAPVTPDSIQSLRAKGDRIEYQLVSIADLGPSVEPDWYWPGYLARGAVTLFTGLWKAGKTTLLGYLLRDLYRGGGLVDGAIDEPILIVSEEPTELWTARRDSLGLPPSIFFLQRDTFARPDHLQWKRLIEQIARDVKERGIGLVIFDTLPSAWPVTNENDAGETLDALSPIRDICAAGAAVMLVHHPRKSDGSEATATRGSGALPGFVDIIVELRRHNPEDVADHRRVLNAWGRYNIPAERVIELGTDGYQILGDRAMVRDVDTENAILHHLPVEGIGIAAEELRELLPITPKPGVTRLRGLLNQGFRDGKWERFGRGVKGDPHLFRARKESTNSIQSPSSLGERNESDSVVDGEGEVAE